MKHISEIYDLIKGVPPKKIAVAMAADKEVLEAVVAAKRKGIVTGLLFGDVGKMEAILKEMGEDPADYELEEAADELEAADKAVMAVSGGKADIVMKGLMNSGNFIRALLNKEHGIRDGQSTLSAMAITEFAVDGEDRVLFITDPGFNTTPDLETKKKILASAIKVMHALGYDEPKVGILSSAETVNPKMVSSTDAAAIDEAAKNGEFGKCLVCGPISLDLALSKKAAIHKGFDNPVAGEADLLLVPELDTGNALLKSIFLIGNRPGGGAVSGTTKPVVFTSRADQPETKLNAIAVAALMSEGMKK